MKVLVTVKDVYQEVIEVPMPLPIKAGLTLEEGLWEYIERDGELQDKKDTYTGTEKEYEKL